MSEKHFEKVAVEQLVLDPAYQALPNWPQEQMLRTVQEIQAEGDVRVPVVIDEGNHVLDGHQRVAAAKEAKVEKISCERIVGLEEVDKLRYVFGQLNRRHLNRAELQKVAREAVQRMHVYSDARISLIIGIATDKTIRAIRLKLIAAGSIPDHENLIGIGGSPQPAKKTKKGGEKKADNTEKPGEKKDEHKAIEPRPDEKKDGQQDGVQAKAQEEHPRPDEVRPEPAKPEDVKPEQPKAEQSQLEGPKVEPPMPEEPKAGPPMPDQAKAEPPKPNDAKPEEDKKGRKQLNATLRVPLVARLAQTVLVLEGKELAGLPQGLAEVECLVVLDAEATHVRVSLDAKRPTLVIFRPDQQQ